MIIEIIIGLSISYLLLFLTSIYLKNNSIVDIFWGIGFLQVTVHSFILNKNSIGNFIILSLIIIWALRISYYIFSKKKLNNIEDKRYAKWRSTWKYFYTRSFFQVFLLQEMLLLIIATPIILINQNQVEISTVLIIGSFISIIGLMFESISDYQLKNFIKHKKAKNNSIMKEGLWKYSRHPNYFGESIFWLGISIIGSTISIWSFVSYIMITFLLRYVSGVPMAEENYNDNLEFQNYKKNTPALIPNFLKK